MQYILAPLRGVTVRTFRAVFAPALAADGFVSCVSPFIPALSAKVHPGALRDVSPANEPLPCVPQAIGKDPAALRALLEAFRRLGHAKADLNAGCPYPMITRKGRGAGLLRSPDVLARMLETGVETMGPGNFSLKVRLGVESPDELAALIPMINRFPLANLTVHARTARQMYTGKPDLERFAAIAEASANPVVYNGDFDPGDPGSPVASAIMKLEPGSAGAPVAVMVGRPFVKNLALREDANDLLSAYLDATERELCGRSSVLGRMKELLAYWREASPVWRRRWEKIKLCRTTSELRMVLGCRQQQATSRP